MNRIKVISLSTSLDLSDIASIAGGNTLSLTRCDASNTPGIMNSIFSGFMDFAVYRSLEGMLADRGFVSLDALKASASVPTWIVDENIIFEQPEIPGNAGVKLSGFVKRKDGMTHDQFVDRYQNGHAPLVVKTPRLRKYCQNYVTWSSRSCPAEFDGLAELWWSTPEDAQASWNSPEIQSEQSGDIPLFTDITAGLFVVGREQRII